MWIDYSSINTCIISDIKLENKDQKSVSLFHKALKINNYTSHT